MNSITEKENEENSISKTIKIFCKNFQVGKALKRANAYKSSGFPVIEIFMYLLQLVYTKKSMYMNLQNGTGETKFGKDTVYRFLNQSKINWSTFMLTLAQIVITYFAGLTSEKRKNVIIVDDTFFGRERSKKVELLANTFDHASKGTKFKRGFRMLTLAWSDGASLVPLLFRHMSSEKQKNRYNEINKGLDKRTAGYKARLQAISTSTEVLLSMLLQVQKFAIPAEYVVFDSWFTFPTIMMKIAKLGFQVVGRPKDTPKIKYEFEGKPYTLSQIYKSMKKRRGKSKYLASTIVTIHNEKTETQEARIVYIRDRNNKKKWIALITTDLSLTETEVIKLYGKRWDIEVFFKMCKSYLNLGSEFQGLSYDTMTAHTAVVMTRYMILALQKRQNEDPRTMGELFFLCFDEVSDIQFVDALNTILALLKEVFEECLFLSVEQVSFLLDTFIAKLPTLFRLKLDRNSAS